MTRLYLGTKCPQLYSFPDQESLQKAYDRPLLLDKTTWSEERNGWVEQGTLICLNERPGKEKFIVEHIGAMQSSTHSS